MSEPIDLRHLGRRKVIGTYLLAGDEPAVVDCGPASCLDALAEGLARQGIALRDLRHLVLTHIHLDHAGAAGSLVRENPALAVHVSEIGAPHLVDPSRLERSARRLYGEDFDRLWGEVVPVPEASVRVAEGAVLGLEAFATPGHASHHVSYLASDGTLYAGDAAGARILPSTYVAPVAPPPDVDLEAWEWTIAAIAERRPERFSLPHFGVVDDPVPHLASLRERLAAWAERVRKGASEEEFTAAAEAELAEEGDGETIAAYRQAAPFWHSHAGLARYWQKRREVRETAAGPRSRT